MPAHIINVMFILITSHGTKEQCMRNKTDFYLTGNRIQWSDMMCESPVTCNW
jgi:hypothetical protein